MPELGWLALLDAPRAGAVPVTDAGTGAPAGHLPLTRGRAKPDRSAVRVEPAVIGDGPALAVSLVLPPRGARPLFDDPAVVDAMPSPARPRPDAGVSTLVEGSTDWAGAVSGIGEPRPGWWDDDPFARLGPRHRLLVPAGVLVTVPLPAGPSHERHAGAPWPWGRFADTR